MKKLILFILFCCSLTILLQMKPIKGDNDNINYKELRKRTNNYYYDESTGVYDLTQPNSNIFVNNYANITVLTPGLSSGAEAWSNRIGDNDKFVYHKDSIISVLDEIFDCNIYLCDATAIKPKVSNDELHYTYTYNFYDVKHDRLKNLINYSEGDEYSLSNRVDANKIDFSKHIIFVYQNGNNNNELLFKEYDNFLNGINIMINEFYKNFDVLPKLNLIGHSRGGLVNFMYMLDHPDMVENFFSLGTPFFGSMAGYIVDNYVANFIYENSPAESELSSSNFFQDKINQWNNNYNSYYSSINLYLMASEMSFYNFIENIDEFVNNNDIIKVIKNIIELLKIKQNNLNFFNIDILQIRNTIFSILNRMGIGSVDAFLSDNLLNVEFDGLVSTKSQLANYNNGLTNSANYCKNYNIYNYNPFKKSRNDYPAFGHNVITQDKDFINFITAKLLNSNNLVADDYLYEILPNNKLLLKNYLGNTDLLTDTLVIPSIAEIDGVTREISEIDSFAFTNLQNNVDITEIVIPSTINVIRSNAFSDLKFVRSIRTTSSSSLTTIENNAFSGCNSLESIYFPIDVSNYNLRSVINCPLLTEIVISNIQMTLYGNISCSFGETFSNSLFFENANTFFIEINSLCKSQYSFTIANLDNILMSVNLFNINLELVQENVPHYWQNHSLKIDVDLNYGYYYLCLNFLNIGGSFDLDYDLITNYDGNLLTIGETKDLMEHYHNGTSYVNFEVDNSGFYYVNLEKFLHQYSIGQGTIKISHYEGEQKIIDYVIPEDGGSFSFFFVSGIEYTLLVENIVPNALGNEALYHLFVTIKEYKDLNDKKLDIDNCYYENINQNSFSPNIVYKLSFKSYSANQIIMRLVGDYTQNVNMFVIEYDNNLEAYEVLYSLQVTNNQLFTYSIQTDINKMYFVGFSNMVFNQNEYVSLSIIPQEYYLLDIYTDPYGGGMQVGTEVSMNGGSYGGCFITEGYTRLIYVKHNGIAISRLNCFFESSNDELLRVSPYGTVTALTASADEILHAFIKVILKSDHSLVGTISFFLCKETNQSYIYCKYGADVRNSGAICGTEVTELGALPIPATGYPTIPIHVNYTRLLCFGNDAPSQLLQDYIFEIDYYSNSLGLVTISDYGTITGINEGHIGILCIYKYNPIYRIYIELDVYS